MCRLFGFRSAIKSQVHQSLVGAENSFMSLSTSHPDGWGVAYYVEGSPHVIKADAVAMEDQLFKRVSGIVSAETIVAHLRKTTIGSGGVVNTHPFQYGKWVFAHNGNVKDFSKVKDQLWSLIPPTMRRYVLGNTDSEILFYLILGELEKLTSLRERNISAQILIQAIQDAVKKITSIIGPCELKHKDPHSNYLTFIITNGETFAAHHGGQSLWLSTYKSRCAERDHCPHFAPECEAESASGRVNHFIVSSEPISGENIWHPLKPGDIVAADLDMNVHRDYSVCKSQ